MATGKQLCLSRLPRERPRPQDTGGAAAFPACRDLSVRGENPPLSHSLHGAFAPVLGNGAVRVGVDSPAV